MGAACGFENPTLGHDNCGLLLVNNQCQMRLMKAVNRIF